MNSAARPLDPSAARGRRAWLRPLSLRAKAVIAFGAVALYFATTFVIISSERARLTRIVEELEGLAQVEGTLARLNLFASHTVLKINESYFVSEPREIVNSVALDVESISAGLGALAGWYPRAGDMVARLEGALEAARSSPARSGVLELRRAMHDLAADLDQLSREARARHESMWTGYRVTYDSVTLLAATLSVLGLAIFGVLVMVFFRRLAWDLRLLALRAVEVVRGYRGAPLPVTRRDEVGALMDAVNDMQRILREREQQIEVARQQRFHQEKMVAIGSLAAAVAHEINNPIAAIEGVAQRISDVRQTQCPTHGVLCHPELILEHTRRIVGITSQLQQLTRPQSTEAEWTDLNSLASATCTFVSYDPRFRAVKMELALDAAVPAVWAVGDHVTQVLMNLLINAADALQASPARRIDVRTALDGDFVRLSVTDTGAGMAPGVAARAFEEGFTTKAEGSGIGLFMCRTLVERAGGRIALESQPGIGTTITIWLPTRSPES
ncbi:MAG: sensor histidine kinase [Betaproteobacteria bacterium]